MPMTWKGTEAERLMLEEMANRLEAAVRFVKEQARENISDTGSPSAPGGYPKKETGELCSGIEVETDRNRLEARVSTNVPHGRILELGTKKMAARPWLLRTIIDNAGTLRQRFGIGRKI